MGATETITRPGGISEREIHDILRNDRRRHALRRLSETAGDVSLSDLAVSIAEHETGESPPPRDAKKSVYNSLHQTHLPKLDDQSVVEYDRDRKTVSLRKSAHAVCLYMHVTTRYGVTWAEYYRTVAVVGLLAVVLSVAETPGFGLVSPSGWAAVFLVVLAGSTLYQVWRRRWLYLQKLA